MFEYWHSGWHMWWMASLCEGVKSTPTSTASAWLNCGNEAACLAHH